MAFAQNQGPMAGTGVVKMAGNRADSIGVKATRTEKVPPWAVPGFVEAMNEVFGAFVNEEPDLNDMIRKIHQKAAKCCERYAKDERLSHRLSSTACKALIEEFVESVMGSVASFTYDKPWMQKVVWTQPLLILVLHAFQTAKIWTRVLKPQVIRFITDGLFKFQEEERIKRCMSEAIQISGIKPEYQKKATQSITKAYDSAFFHSPYGSTENESPELAVLQDFVKGWMTDFVLNAQWDCLGQGLADTSKESQVSTVSVLFQNLLDPNVACMPAEIATEVTNTLGGLPASPWPFLDECSLQVFEEVERSAKRRRPNPMGKS
jgi:hypothetical protein